MSTLAAYKTVPVIKILLLICMTVQFSANAAPKRPAGVRTALELLDRKWLLATALHGEPGSRGSRVQCASGINQFTI